METKTKQCAVCGCTGKLKTQTPNDFQVVCEKHTEYAGNFQLDNVKLHLGFIDKLPSASCSLL